MSTVEQSLANSQKQLAQLEAQKSDGKAELAAIQVMHMHMHMCMCMCMYMLCMYMLTCCAACACSHSVASVLPLPNVPPYTNGLGLSLRFQAACDAEEDRVFAHFSKSLGVASVREYEEKRLRAARERQAELLFLQQQRSKLKAKVLLEQCKDLPATLDKLRASIAEDERSVARKQAQMAKVCNTRAFE